MPQQPGSTTSTEASDQRFAEVMNLLHKQDKEALSSDLQAFVQKEGVKTTQVTAKQRHSAVHDLTKAEKAMDAAINSRTNLLASWRSFLAASLTTWKDYTEHFQKQEEQCRKEILEAKEALSKANVRAQEGLNLKNTKTEPSEMQVISDEEDPGQQQAQASTERILTGLQNMTANLAELAAKAEVEHQEAQRQAKRPRRSEAPDAQMATEAFKEEGGADGNGTSAPFVQPGQ